MSRRVFFLGANGFPAAVYEPLFKSLESRHSIITRPVEYHHELVHRKTKSWNPLIDTVISQVQEMEGGAGAEGLTAVGHSAGGALLAIAANRRPDLFKHVVIVDSPMFSPFKRFAFSLGFNMPTSVVEQVHPLIKVALKKKHEWDTIEDAEEYFKSRRLYKSFHQDVVQSMLDNGLRIGKNCGKVKLVFSHKSEAQMYLTTPTETPIIGQSIGMGQYGAVSQEGTFLYSSKFAFLNKGDVNFLRGHFKGLKFKPFVQGHFWPMEDPHSFGDTVREVLEDAGV